MMGIDVAFHLVPVYTTLTSLLIFFSVWLLRRDIKQQKGDIQKATTYAYGSVRQYPKVTWYHMAEELFYVQLYRWIAFYKNNFKWRNHPLTGENIVHDFSTYRRH